MEYLILASPFPLPNGHPELSPGGREDQISSSTVVLRIGNEASLTFRSKCVRSLTSYVAKYVYKAREGGLDLCTVASTQ